MIDWAAVGRGALWITGLAIALAAFSYTECWRSVQGGRLRDALGTPHFLGPFSLGMALFSTGVALSSHQWWEIGAWAITGTLFLLQSALNWRAGRQNREDDEANPLDQDQM
jgi:hypothetical protein